MPGIFHTPHTRKDFIRASAIITGGLLMANDVVDAAEESPSAHLALLSDTHIPADATNEYRGFKPVDNLKKIVPQVLASKPHVAVLNGDAARLTGQREDYVALKALLAPVAAKTPIHIGLGNHDDRQNFFRVFDHSAKDGAAVEGKHVSVFELAGTRFVVLDSLLYVDKVAGLLGKAQRDWLAKLLQTSDDRPTVFFVHHTLGDADGDLLDFDRVFEVMKSHRKVKAIFYGHSHRYHIEQREHIYLINQPAIGYNFNDSEPVGWLDATFTPQGVAMTLLAIGGNVSEQGKTSNVVWA